MATEQDWAAYATAVVDLEPPGGPPRRLVPDTPGAVGAWPDGLPSPVVVVTAWDPDSVRQDEAVNRDRSRRLVEELEAAGLASWPATGRDDDGHHEEGVAVTGLDEAEGLALGRRHGQAAVYVWRPDAWEIVACDGSRRVTLGWRLVDAPGTDG